MESHRWEGWQTSKGTLGLSSLQRLRNTEETFTCGAVRTLKLTANRRVNSLRRNKGGKYDQVKFYQDKGQKHSYILFNYCWMLPDDTHSLPGFGFAVH